MTDHLASMGAVSVPRAAYAELLSAAVGGASAAGSEVSEGAAAAPPPDFFALEALLEAEGAAGAGGPAGKFIAQLFTQTS